MDERATRFVVGISVGILVAWLLIKIYAAFAGHAAGTGPFHGLDPHATPEGQLELQQLLKLQQQARARQADTLRQQEAEQAKDAAQHVAEDKAKFDENQARLMKAEAALKQREDAWLRFYVPTPACADNIFGPGCAEAKLKARKAFDAQYPPPPPS